MARAPKVKSRATQPRCALSKSRNNRRSNKRTIAAQMTSSGVNARKSCGSVGGTVGVPSNSFFKTVSVMNQLSLLLPHHLHQGINQSRHVRLHPVQKQRRQDA